MLLNNEQDILRAVQVDGWMMDVLRTAAALHLPDWWVCAGFVRSKLWDTLHSYSDRTALPDVDVVYFDPANLDEKLEKDYEQRLKSLMPGVPWSVKNEARMHAVNHVAPYTSAVDAISRFPETATALGLKLDAHGKLHLTAPWGIEDALHMILKPSPHFAASEGLMEIYFRRLEQKDWRSIWPKVQAAANP